MAVIKDVIYIMEETAPEGTACLWDNVGLLVGDENRPVKNVIIALDCEEKTIKQAIQKNAELIITHHPVIFKPISRITAQDAVGKRLTELVKNDIAVYSAHTNLDIAKNGTNDTLFDMLNLDIETPLVSEDEVIGRAGFAEKNYALSKFAEYVSYILNADGVCFVGDKNAIVGKIGICAGSGAKYMDAVAKNGCNTYLTGDVSYSNARYALDLGLNLVVVPHFAAEVLITHALRDYLTKKAGELNLGVKFFTQEGQKDVFTYL